jgi:cytochrome P450
MRTDGEPHMRVRRMLNHEFTVRRAEQLRPIIERIVADRLNAMEKMGPPVDLVTSFALPVPSSTICLILGVPCADHEMFQSRTSIMINTESTPDQVRGAAMGLHQYLFDLVASKTAEPGAGRHVPGGHR